MIADPYQVMGIDPSSDSETIRKRYLALVREFSPERAPERFAEIRAAYETLRDPVTSLQMRLFDLRSSETFDKLIADERQQIGLQRIAAEALLSLAHA
jgi:curved DNA-binding protein CbpA